MREGWRTVFVLGATSLLADVSSEMMTAVLPFLLVAQGASGLAVGLFGAASETVGNLTKWLGGRWGDRVKHRRLLVASGYFGAGAARVGIALATSWWGSLFWRSLDRVGKGVRTAPRDAILSNAVPPQERGRAFGAHRAFDTTGAFLGVVGALAFLAWTTLDAGRIVLVAAFVGVAATLPLLLLREPGPAGQGRHATKDDAPRRGFWALVTVSCLFAAGQASLLFVLLRAGGGGRSEVLGAVLWYLLYNAVYAAASFPFGAWSDRVGKKAVLGVGFALTGGAQLVFALPAGPLVFAAGFAGLGLAWAATDATGRALAADLAGSKTSTQLGVYHALIGVATLSGGVVGGLVWDRLGQGPFFVATGGAALAACVLWLAVGRRVGTAMA